jgi:hypothetical protein
MTPRLTSALLLAASVQLDIAAAEHAAARVTAVAPQAGRLPANLLRFYVHFSAPMAQATSTGTSLSFEPTVRWRRRRSSISHGDSGIGNRSA